MQKIGKNASILLWSIFLSLTMSIAFISISSQISKNLKENSNLNEKISIANKKQNLINEAIETGNFEIVEISNNEILVFEKNNFLNIGLKENEVLRLKVDIDTNMTIIINDGSPVSYSNTSDSNVNGITSSSNTFSTGVGEILIKNLGLYSNINIFSEGSFEKEYKKYKIVKKVGNKDIIKESSQIKIF
ncbi:MAG: hypothetical protein PHH98_00555 [Candidatus Gracilibacteria bacterium]|nr:hypothetical protein [Candidatus Gracilibacteria bacterium]